MKRTALSAVVAVVGMSLVIPAASAAPAPPAAMEGQAATTLLTGTLLLLADAHRGEAPSSSNHPHDEDAEQAFLEVDGSAVPLTPSAVAGLGGGATLTVQVPVPATVVDAVAQGEPVAVTTPAAGAEEVVIPPRKLDAAQERPAPAGSDLAAATAVAAGESGVPVAASVVQVAPAATVPASDQPHEVTVAVVGVNGKTDARYTDAEVARLVDETSRYWSDQTAGAVTFRTVGQVARWTSSISCTNATALWNEARTRTGFQGGDNRHLVVMVPRAAYDARYCSYGLGSVGSGVSSGGVSYVADTRWSVLAHELGHNMSLQHANRLACGVAKPDVAQTSIGALTGGCSEADYGDLADVMSSSSMDATGGLGVVGLRRLGFLEPGAQQAVSASGVTDLTLAPLGGGAGLRVATVTDPRNGNVYHLENRQAVGRDVYGFGGSGLRDAAGPGGAPAGLRVLKQGASGTSILLDPTPSACGSSCQRDADVVVAPGTTFRSAADGVEVRVRQLADRSVAAEVSVASAGVRHWPGDPGTPTVLTAAAVRPRAGSTTALPVTVATASGAPVTGGTVTASAGDVRLAVATVSGGRATLTLPVLAKGRQDLVVAYQPSSSADGPLLAGSSAAVALDVPAALARVMAGLAVRRVTVVDTASVTVAVSAPGTTPTGTVTVTEDGAPLGAATLVKGRATVGLPVLALGRHSFVATYDGDERVDGARSAPVVLTVTPLPVSVVTAAVSRATAGQAATLTATVRAAGRPATGEVTAVRDGKVVASGQLTAGRAVLALPVLPAGRYELSLAHADSPRVTGGTRAVSLVVAPARPSVRAVPAATTLTQGSTTTVAVEVGAPGVEATGAVRLLRGSQVLDSAGLTDGRAVLTVPAGLPLGRQVLTMAYAGSSELAAGSTVVAVTVAR